MRRGTKSTAGVEGKDKTTVLLVGEIATLINL
jgi:hypothetical protein